MFLFNVGFSSARAQLALEINSWGILPKSQVYRIGWNVMVWTSAKWIGPVFGTPSEDNWWILLVFLEREIGEPRRMLKKDMDGVMYMIYI